MIYPLNETVLSVIAILYGNFKDSIESISSYVLVHDSKYSVTVNGFLVREYRFQK